MLFSNRKKVVTNLDFMALNVTHLAPQIVRTTCHIQNGTCFACQPGWIGTTCFTSKTDFIISIYIVGLLFISILNISQIDFIFALNEL